MLFEIILSSLFDLRLAYQDALGSADLQEFCADISAHKHSVVPQARRDELMRARLKKLRSDPRVQKTIKELLILLMPTLDPYGMYGNDLFHVISEYMWTPAIEAVAIRRNKESGRLEIYLAARSREEPAYPGEVHCPGTSFRPSDIIVTEGDPKKTGKIPEPQFARLAAKEFFPADAMQFVGIYYNKDEERGPYISIVYLITNFDNLKEFKNAKWYDLEEAYILPNLVEHHRSPIIPMAEEAFLRREEGLPIIPKAL